MKEGNGLGRYIRRERQKQEMMGRQLADRLHVDGATISRWENGQVPVPCEMVPEIARLLGVPEVAKKKMRECQVWCYLREVAEKAKAA